MLAQSSALAAHAESPVQQPDPDHSCDGCPGPARQHSRLRLTTPVRAPQSGWHWIPWLCEYLGTALLLAGGLSAVFLDFGPYSPVARDLPSTSARLLLTGLLFGGTGSLIALSPIGPSQRSAPQPRRDGRVLDPAQGAPARPVRLHHRPTPGRDHRLCPPASGVEAHSRGPTPGATQPGHGFSDVAAAGLETAMTASLVLTILLMTSSTRTARWTPLGNWLLVATLVWQGAPYTGTSLNPARSLGPALIAPLLTNLWPYLVGPLAGALVAAGIFAFFPRLNTLTAKISHDPRYRSTLGSDLPTASTGRHSKSLR